MTELPIPNHRFKDEETSSSKPFATGGYVHGGLGIDSVITDESTRPFCADRITKIIDVLNQRFPHNRIFEKDFVWPITIRPHFDRPLFKWNDHPFYTL